MFQKLLIKAVSAVLADAVTKEQIFGAIDRAVKDTASPIDDKAAEVFKALYDAVVSVLK